MFLSGTVAPSLCSDPEGVDLESSDPHFGVIRMSPLEVIDRRWAGAKAGPSSLAAISLCMLHFADYAWGLWEVEILFIYFICLLFMCLGTHVEVRGNLLKSIFSFHSVGSRTFTLSGQPLFGSFEFASCVLLFYCRSPSLYKPPQGTFPFRIPLSVA